MKIIARFSTLQINVISQQNDTKWNLPLKPVVYFSIHILYMLLLLNVNHFLCDLNVAYGVKFGVFKFREDFHSRV